jgi:transcription factor SPN1
MLSGKLDECKPLGLGRIIMFLSTLPEETPANRKACRTLVEKWSRPAGAYTGPLLRST